MKASFVKNQGQIMACKSLEFVVFMYKMEGKD